jgi:hypothetical protein
VSSERDPRAVPERSLEQEVAAGTTPATPAVALAGVISVIAAVVAIVLGVAFLVYFLV